MRKFYSLVLLLLCGFGASAQYSGTYSIEADGSGYFSTLQEAQDSLLTYGISGTVTLQLGSGTYSGTAISLKNIPLSSSQQLIVRGDFSDSADFTILENFNDSANQPDYVLELDGVNNVHFRNIVFLRGNPFSTGARAVQFANSVDDVSFTQCAFINFNSSGNTVRSQNRTGNLSFDSCAFAGGSIALRMVADTGLMVANSFFQDFSQSGISASRSMADIQYSQFDIFDSSLTDGTGIFLDNSSGTINGNQIRLPLDGIGIAVQSVPDSARVWITNNYVNVSSVTKSAIALQVDSSRGAVDILNNTLRGTGDVQATSAALVWLTNSASQTRLTLFSNAIINQSSAIALSVDTLSMMISQRNAFYSTDSAELIQFGGGNDLLDLAGWQQASNQDKNSIQGLPQFDSTGYRWTDNLLLNKGQFFAGVALLDMDIDRQMRDSAFDIGAWEGAADSMGTDTTITDTTARFVKLFGLGAGGTSICDADSFVISYSARGKLNDTLANIPITIRIARDSAEFFIYDTLNSFTPSDTLNGRAVFRPGGNLFGTYTITAYTDTAYDSDTLTTSISFFSTPQIEATVNDSVQCGGESFQFISTVVGGGNTTRTWRFPDGTTATGDSVTFRPGSTFRQGTVVLTVVGEGGCTASDSVRIYSSPTLSANFTIVERNVNDSGFDVRLTAIDTTSGATYSWSVNGAMDTLSGRSITLSLDSGIHTFMLRVTNNGCSDTLTRKFFLRKTGIAARNTGPQLSIYPNPVTNGEAWVVSLGHVSGLAQVSLWNVSGQQVWIGNASQSQALVPSAGLQAGVYLLRVQDASGISTARVVVR